MNFNLLKYMLDKKLVEGLPGLPSPKSPCNSCVGKKQSRVPFPPMVKFIAAQPLDLIHGNVWHPMSPPTWGGNSYFRLLVDDFSILMWISLMKTKSEALGSSKNSRPW